MLKMTSPSTGRNGATSDIIATYSMNKEELVILIHRQMKHIIILLFKLCKFHEEINGQFFSQRSKCAILCLSIKVIAPSIRSVSIDLHVKCPFYRKRNKKKWTNFYRVKFPH